MIFKNKRTPDQIFYAVVTAIAMLPLAVSSNPDGAVVINGNVTTSESVSRPGHLTIVNSDGAIIEWNSFNIAPGELTEFLQANPGSRVLNRVVGVGVPTEINGQLVSNGKVFLIDANGIVVGKSGSISTNGLVLSTLDISNENFKNGDLQFTGSTSGARIINDGQISSNEDAYLLAGELLNNGTISANQNVLLSAGDNIFIETEAGNLVGARADGNGLITNNGRVSSTSGLVGILAATIVQRNSSVAAADNVIISEDGDIELSQADGTATDGTATDGTATDGTATDGTATDGTATDGTATDGTATDGTATDGTATDGTATDGTATDGTATDGTATDGIATDGTSTDGATTDGDSTAVAPPPMPPASGGEEAVAPIDEIIRDNESIVSGSVNTGGTGSTVVTGGAGNNSSVPTDEAGSGIQVAATATGASNSDAESSDDDEDSRIQNNKAAATRKLLPICR